jgi:GNAT superfamily N-acetyltransferase
MTLRCEGSPSRLPDKTRDDIRRLDRIIFKGSPRVELEGAWWWLVRDEEGAPIAFCGMRTAVMGCHAGMAYMVRSGVLKAHRGQGIQKRMIKARCALAKRYGFSAVVTYVMDWNLASSNSLISCGFKFYKPQVKYYGDDVLYFQRKFSSVG